MEKTDIVGYIVLTYGLIFSGMNIFGYYKKDWTIFSINIVFFIILFIIFVSFILDNIARKKLGIQDANKSEIH